MRKALREMLRSPLGTVSALFKRVTAKDDPDYVVEGFNELAKKPVEIDIFLSETDLSVNFMERHFGPDLAKLGRDHIRVHRVHHTDHTIRALFAQKRFFEILRASLERIAKA
jgi:hypothetical protein